MAIRFVYRLLAFLWLVRASSLPAADPARPDWKAGVAKVKITPDQPLWLSGYASRSKPAEGTLHDLWAKALFVEDSQGKQAVLVTLDLVGIGRDLSQAVCADLMKAHSLPREAITLSVSHTHTGPVVWGNLNLMYPLDEHQQRLLRGYAETLHQRIVEVVGAARKNLNPARLEWRIGAADFAVNRRNNKEAEVPQLRANGTLKGPVDHEVPVLSVRDNEGKLRAIVFGYACHATVLDFYQWSGDYPGFAQLQLEAAHPGAVALFWAGCGGDQNPLPRRTVALAEKYGSVLAESVEDVLNTPGKLIKGSLRLAYEEINLPFGDLPTRENLIRDTMDKNKYVALRARELLRQIEAKGSIRGVYPYPVQAWQLGPDLTWIMLGGEVVVDYSLRLKKELGPGKVWVMAYANDVMAYIPSRRVLKEGGYEGATSMIYYGLPTVWGPGIEEAIVKAAHARAMKVREH